MKTILVPFYDDEAGHAALATAALLAQRFHSYIEGLLVRAGPHLDIGRGIPVPADYLSEYSHQWRAFAESTRSAFQTMIRNSGFVPGEVETQGQGPIAGWREMEGDEGVVGEYGRLFDLIVVGRSQREEDRWRQTAETALFESGRPVLLVPPHVPRSLGDIIVIAWNGSTETARSVALAMPLLTTARQVVVLSIEGGMLPGPSGRDLATHLARAGVPATARTAQPASRTTGEAFLHETQGMGADLLIKGAYTRSRLRQMVFGGTTEHVLKHATIPVLLAH